MEDRGRGGQPWRSGTVVVTLAMLVSACALPTTALPTTALPAASPNAASARYLVGITSQAQAHAGGGVLDAVVVVRVGADRVTIERIADAAELRPNTAAPSGLDPGYYRLFGHSLMAWPDLAMTPDGPSVGQSWLQAWHNTTGQHLDGAVDIDSAALARLLQDAGVGLHSPDGRTFSSTTSMANELAVGMLRRTPGVDAASRAARLAELAPAIRRLLAHAPTASVLLQRLQPSLHSGRAWIYSADVSIQRALVAAARAGSIRSIPSHEVRLRFNNRSGNRADAYLQTMASVRFPTPETSVVTVRLHLDPALALETSSAVFTRHDAQAASGPGELVQTVYSVGLAVHTYTVLVNGHHIVTHSAWYDGHPTVIVPVNLRVGADVTMTYTMTGHADIRHLVDGALPGSP